MSCLSCEYGGLITFLLVLVLYCHRYKKLCGIEFHQVENVRLRKEISESYAVLHAVQKCCDSLGMNTKDTNHVEDDINLENIFLIDLCSGKGMTTALCGVLDDSKGRDSNNFYLAMDKMLPHTIPHFLNEKQIQYLCRDVMVDEIFAEIEGIVKQQKEEHGRSCILVGMHLCGLLSERAIDLFERINDIRGLVLSPCCLPKKHEQQRIRFTKGKPGQDDDFKESGDLYNYFKWSHYLKERVMSSGGACTSFYTDNEMHTEKNAIIVGVRK